MVGKTEGIFNETLSGQAGATWQVCTLLKVYGNARVSHNPILVLVKWKRCHNLQISSTRFLFIITLKFLLLFVT